MSFGESVISTGFIQKTIKVDLDVRINCAYLPRNGHQKVLEDSRGLHTKVEDEMPPGPTCRPPDPWAHLSASASQCRFPTTS
jgi:hypothetical protein